MNNLRESSIMVSFAEALKAKNWLWDPSTSHVIGECMVASCCEFLKLKKTKEKVAIVIKDMNNVFKCAFILEFNEADEDEEATGNYNLTGTFNEADLADVGQVYDCHDMFFQKVTCDTSLRLHRMQYNKDRYIVDLFSLFVDKVYEWLDVNAKEGEVVSVDSDGYFEAAVEIENGHKIFALTPGAVAKQIIKDDLSIQK